MALAEIPIDRLNQLRSEGAEWTDLLPALEGLGTEDEVYSYVSQVDPRYKSLYDEKVPYGEFKEALLGLEQQEKALAPRGAQETQLPQEQPIAPLAQPSDLQQQEEDFFAGTTPPVQDLSAELRSADTQSGDTLLTTDTPLGGVSSAAARYQIGEQNMNVSRALGRGDITYEQAKAQQQATPEQFKGSNWVSESALAVAEMLPGILQGGAGALQTGIGSGLATAGAAATVGGPAAAPAAAAGFAPGFAVGSTYGSAKVWQEQGKGDLYMTLRDEGVPDNIAGPVSTAFSIPYAGLELLQVNKLIPAAVKTKVMGALSKGVAGTLARLAAEKGVDYVKNVGQEVVQELITATGERVGEELAGVEVPADKKPILDRLAETAKAAAGSFAILSVPGAAVDAATVLRNQQINEAVAPLETAATEAEAIAPATAAAARQTAQELQRTARITPPIPQTEAQAPEAPTQEAQAIPNDLRVERQQVEAATQATSNPDLKRALDNRLAEIDAELAQTLPQTSVAPVEETVNPPVAEAAVSLETPAESPGSDGLQGMPQQPAATPVSEVVEASPEQTVAAVPTVKLKGVAPNGFFSQDVDVDLDVAERQNNAYLGQVDALTKCIQGR